MPSNNENNKVNIFESIERRFLSGDYELAELRKLDINKKEVYQFYGYLKQDKVLNIKFKGFIKQRKDNTNNITGIITSFYSETNETNLHGASCCAARSGRSRIDGYRRFAALGGLLPQADRPPRLSGSKSPCRKTRYPLCGFVSATKKQASGK